MTTPPDKSLHPPLAVWKLALLLACTATLYQFMWLFRTTSDLRDARDPAIQPWHWVLIPLLGPFVFVPGQKIAAYLKDWQVEDNKDIGHLADPVMVGMIMFVAYLPLLLLIIDPLSWPLALLMSWLILCLAYLALQGQLNLNKQPADETAFRAAPWRFAKHQAWAAGIGAIVAVPLYVTMFTNVRENWSAAELEPGAVIAAGNGLYQVRILDEGWSQVGENFMESDAELEFYGPQDWTWAAVYDAEGLSVDEVLEFRESFVRETYSRASCTQVKTLDDETWTIRGRVECEGRSPLDGDYLYASSVLRNEEVVVELLAFTSDGDSARFAALAERVRTFTEGLELIL